MARWGVHRPKRLGERYESLAGDLEERRWDYLFKRHLGINPSDRRELLWWEHKIYVDGLLWEFSDQDPDEVVEGTTENLQDLGFSAQSV